MTKNKISEFKNKQLIYDLVKTFIDDLIDISEDEIEINITDDTMPNLEFYDMPSLISHPESSAKKSYNYFHTFLHILDNRHSGYSSL